MSEVLFVNGPFDGQYVEVEPVLFSVIDVCEPLSGEPELWKMVPNQGIWKYDLQMVDIYSEDPEDPIYLGQEPRYIGSRYRLGEDVTVPAGEWTKVGRFSVHSDVEVSVYTDRASLEFSDLRVRFDG